MTKNEWRQQQDGRHFENQEKGSFRKSQVNNQTESSDETNTRHADDMTILTRRSGPKERGRDGKVKSNKEGWCEQELLLIDMKLCCCTSSGKIRRQYTATYIATYVGLIRVQPEKRTPSDIIYQSLRRATCNTITSDLTGKQSHE